MDNKKLALQEWAIIFILLSSIVAVFVVGGVKRQVIKGKVYKTFVLSQKRLLEEYFLKTERFYC